MKQAAPIGVAGAVLVAAAALVFCRPIEAATPQTADEAKTIANLLEHHYHNAKTLRAVFLERYTEGPKGFTRRGQGLFFPSGLG